ncbi:MAG: biosynthetic-type acetolactate synthase large subunit [bacterium]|nr:biosynthetic-type acetolactate synthase large subunit [bacterium]
MAITGAEIIVDALVREGVQVVFGYPGGCVLDIFDRINHVPGLRFVLVRHEQGAGHMADGYARATGRPGVALVTSGPGATNLVTALATAYMDSVPIVALTGQVPTAAIGSDAFQEADIVGITRPCTKHNFLVKDVADLARTIKEAFYIATSGRPGPVVIDLPKDVQKAKLENYVYPEQVRIRSYHPVIHPDAGQIRRAAEAIARASRPLLYVGGGAVECQSQLVALSERCDIPCTTTLLGMGIFPGDHANSVHMLGMHGTQYANYAMHHTDLIIAVGTRFDDRVTGKLEEFAPRREHIIHIDVDPASISKCIPVSIPIVGDCRQVLDRLLPLVEPKKHHEWIEQVRRWKADYPLRYPDDDKLRPQHVIRELYRATGGEAIVATEVGQHQMWAAHFWQYVRPRTFLSSGGLGTMGYGFPAALGAQVAFPDRLVLDIAGDGSIQMNIQELATAVTEKLPVKICIINNRYLGMVRQWQQLFYKENYSGTFLGTPDGRAAGASLYIPDFVKLAEAYGAAGIRVARKADVAPAIKEAIANGRTTILEVMVEEKENVWPMIPAGAGVEQMISGLA